MSRLYSLHQMNAAFEQEIVHISPITYPNNSICRYFYDEFLKRLEAQESQSPWQPIETAPKDGSEFVTANANQGFVKELVSWNSFHRFWQSKGQAIYMQATHWMPLPSPPVEAQRQEGGV